MPELNAEQLFVARHFSKAAASYDASAKLQKRVIKQASNLLTLSPDSTLLDVGCGTGNLQKFATSIRYIGVDVAPGMLQIAKDKVVDSNHTFVAADAHQLPFKDHSFTHVFSSLVWQWCELSKVVQQAARVLKPGGQLVFTTLIDGTLKELKTAYQSLDSAPHVNQFMPYKTLNDVLSQCGHLKIQKIDTIEEKTCYGSAHELLQELKAIGANTLTQTRQVKPLTKDRLAKLEAAYPINKNGQKFASWSVAYCVLNKI
ncbi:methyltransferase domain-containing protein [Catenovulum sediminis]|uniref:methyltransferase domain-containing protein n=1 Tax=Catenovulum sediminis TaxID=1740262 RepID=UPI00117D9E56|nr:methyltransferase domain-containing protein [Catenovulum sediminis]